MNYTRIEQETVINFNEEENIARVYTFNRALQNRLSRLAADRPEECCIDPDERLSLDGAKAFIVPKKWVTVRPPRTYSLTDEEKAARAARFLSAQALSA